MIRAKTKHNKYFFFPCILILIFARTSFSVGKPRSNFWNRISITQGGIPVIKEHKRPLVHQLSSLSLHKKKDEINLMVNPSSRHSQIKVLNMKQQRRLFQSKRKLFALISNINSDSNSSFFPVLSVMGIIRGYNRWLIQRPVVSNFISGTTIVVLGDLLAQCIEQVQDHRKSLFLSKETKNNIHPKNTEKDVKITLFTLMGLEGFSVSFDKKRILDAGLLGILYNGILLPRYYTVIHKLWPVDNLQVIAKKVATGMLVWGMIGNSSNMFLRRLLDGSNVEDAILDVKREIIPVILNDYKIWPIYDILCYSIIPRHIQPICTATMGVGWCSYMSYITHGPENVNNVKKQE